MNGKGMNNSSGYLGSEQSSIMMQVKDMMHHDKTLIKSASKAKTGGGILKGVFHHQNVYADKSFMVMNENRGLPVMITA